MLVFNHISEVYEIILDSEFKQYNKVGGTQKADNTTDARGNLIKPKENIYFGNKTIGKHTNHENIISYYKHGESTTLDYKQVRREVKRLMELKGVLGLGTDIVTGLENLNETEILFASELFILRNENGTVKADCLNNCSLIFHVKSEDCRRKRMGIALVLLLNSINTEQKTIVVPMIPSEYEMFITLQQPAIYSFIDIELRALEFISDALADKLIDILNNGI